MNTQWILNRIPGNSTEFSGFSMELHGLFIEPPWYCLKTDSLWTLSRHSIELPGHPIVFMEVPWCFHEDKIHGISMEFLNSNQSSRCLRLVFILVMALCFVHVGTTFLSTRECIGEHFTMLPCVTV